ncbi:MAG: hypothetical protein CM1200mP30_34520 [Pseudomonadota bacterium]|nr:MAG: hypothetical protein CM1200mP30_34520 [Pseudomonadota bacterium]
MKQVDFDESMVRAIAVRLKQSENPPAKVIHAEGELQASPKLLESAQTLPKAVESMQLRYFQPLTEIPSDKTNTIVFHYLWTWWSLF